MKLLIIVAALAASCSADLLALRQRAPQSAYSAGGGDFLNSPRNTYIPPQNNYLPPSNIYQPPKPQYLPPAVTTSKPTTQYLPPQKPTNSYLPPQNSYLPPGGNKPVTPPVPILKQINEIHEDGSYKYETLTGDQTHIEQMGHIENLGTDHEEQVMHGSYSYVGDDGKTYTVTYVADSNGFRAFGDHLPTPPPIPEAIQQALDQNAREEAAQGNQGYPSGPSQGYPSGPAQGYPSGPAGGYPSGPPQQTYLPPNKPSFNPQSGYQY